jgi:hypothetical protein
MNEKDTLDSLRELAPGDAALAGHIGRLKQAVQAVGDAQVLALEAHADAAARRTRREARDDRPLGPREKGGPVRAPADGPGPGETATGSIRN